MISTRSLTFHPLVVLTASLAGALAYAAWATSRFDGNTLSSQYLYIVPIVVPFVAFLFDRGAEIRTAGFAVLAIDALVIATSILRARGYVPLISGHALFLIYAVLRPIVMVETMYLKFFVWHDFVTPVGGTVLALIAVAVVRRLSKHDIDREVELV